MNKDTLLSEIKGVGEKTASLLNKLNINNAGDIISYYPRSYDEYEYITLIKDIRVSEKNAVYATVKSIPKIHKYNGKSIVSFFIYDDSNVIEVKFFNSPFMAKTIKIGDKKVFRGYVKRFRDSYVMEQPKIYSYEDYCNLQGTISPVYSLTKDLSNERMKKFVKTVLDNYSDWNDYLSKDECVEYSLSSIKDALYNIHFPSDYDSQYYARRRIVFDEFMSFIRISREGKGNYEKLNNIYKMIDVADCTRLEEALPYKLTGAQKKAIEEISNDLSSDYLMNRLVQGDVGSGKTIVAIMAMLKCVANGYQASMIAPTEVLAKQHFSTIKELTAKYHLPFRPVLLVGKMPAKDKREALQSIADGTYNVVLGTHAVITDKVEFNNLALAITDEQHRFGVKQREAFKNKGLEPHILVMSATPIPRTLAMVLFANISVSVIDELPKNRIPISNCVVDSSFRIKAYEKIKSEIDKGHQAYVICPMVTENEMNELELKSVEQHSKDIKDYFDDKYRVGTLSGKMKPDIKSSVMEEFKNHNIDILVSTTVIEVGIDVPNATVILIENAERFGLSTLHQLRGRVGRGNFESFCILLSDSKKQPTLKRLKVLNETNDGFKIANEDMKLRGPGELNGIRQSGELEFGLANISNDSDIFSLACAEYSKLESRFCGAKYNLIDFRTI